MYFIDVQGTLIDDVNRLPIEGSIELIDRLNNQEIPYMVVTNNTKEASEDFLAYLNTIGLNIPTTHYLDPLMVLRDTLPLQLVAAYGAPKFLERIEELGYKVDFDNPKSVLIGIKKEFSNDEYADMVGAIMKGAKLIGMHETTLYAKDGKRYPGVGAILKMLEFATGAAYEVVGKPSIPFYNQALARLQAQTSVTIDFENITMISDDVKGDLIGIQALGAKTVFVLSGKYSDADEILPTVDKAKWPDEIKQSVKEVEI
jgi:NagD protein